MKKAIFTILLFALLILAITSPFAALAGLMLFLLGTALLRTLWSLVEGVVGSPDREPS